MADATDAELVTAYRSGDAASLDFLVKRHTPMVLELVRRLRPPPWVDREDLIQEGMMAIVRAARLWDSTRGSRFSTYLWRAIHNAVGRTLQRAMLHQANNITVEPVARLSRHPVARPEIDLSILDPTTRLVVSLRFGLSGLPDLTWRELAEMTGLTIQQAKSLFDQAITQLLTS